MRELIIILSGLLISAGYLFAYKKRIKLVSLGLTFSAFIIITLGFNTLSVAFNKYSVSTEICDSTLQMFSPKYGNLSVRKNDSINEIMTCLNSEHKQYFRA